MVKRLVDIVISALLLLVAMPLLLLAALAIVLTSPGPVLFRQRRMGRGFRPFSILKLRTMVHAEAGLAYTLGPDPRITPLGRVLRATKLDELPQLWNVLRGEMSLVGPRPVLPELTEEFHEYYSFLLRVRPGLTDPASLKYCRETELLAQAADPLGFFKTVVTPDKLRISFEYMGQANLWTDAATLAMTAVVCCYPPASRVYGKLPDVPADVPEMVPELVEVRKPVRAVAAVDEAIFSHQLAYLEAAQEEMPGVGFPPWIPVQRKGFQPQSTVSGIEEGVSRL